MAHRDLVDDEELGFLEKFSYSTLVGKVAERVAIDVNRNLGKSDWIEWMEKSVKTFSLE